VQVQSFTHICCTGLYWTVWCDTYIIIWNKLWKTWPVILLCFDILQTDYFQLARTCTFCTMLYYRFSRHCRVKLRLQWTLIHVITLLLTVLYIILWVSYKKHFPAYFLFPNACRLCTLLLGVPKKTATLMEFQSILTHSKLNVFEAFRSVEFWPSYGTYK